MNELNLERILIYPDDKTVIWKMVRTLKHIALIKALLKYLNKNKDEGLPILIIEFCHRRCTKGYRASVILLLEKYDCKNYLYDILTLFLRDSFNVTWYTYDILIKYIVRIGNDDLEKFSALITEHLINEKCKEKKEYHELFLKKVNAEIKKREKQSNI
jgi:hypothetical protein